MFLTVDLHADPAVDDGVAFEPTTPAGLEIPRTDPTSRRPTSSTPPPLAPSKLAAARLAWRSLARARELATTPVFITNWRMPLQNQQTVYLDLGGWIIR